MSTTFSTTAPLSGAGLHQISSWRLIVAVPSGLLRLWAARRRQRRALRDLAEQRHLLADIGLTRAQALREAAKPFWCS
jgi:uncharacterized protein YjiS (DUF1127 family)